MEAVIIHMLLIILVMVAAKHFAKQYHVIAIDTRGHGKSPLGDEPFSLYQFAEDLNEFMNEQKIEKANILGFSDGGNIALIFASEYPEKVIKLIANGANTKPSGIKPLVHLAMLFRYMLYSVAAAFSGKFELKKALYYIMLHEPHITKEELRKPLEELGGKSLGETLLTPTVIYVKPILQLLEKVTVKAISHITGGGFYENIPRSIPDGLGAKIKMDDVRVLPIFKLIQKTGDVSTHDMFNTYNMGVGMSVVVAREDEAAALEVLRANGVEAYHLGEIIKSDDKVVLE